MKQNKELKKIFAILGRIEKELQEIRRKLDVKKFQVKIFNPLEDYPSWEQIKREKLGNKFQMSGEKGSKNAG